MKKVLTALLAAIIVIALVVPAAAASFPDVASSHQYYDAIELLKYLSVVGGDEKGNFNPNNTITRAEFSKIAFVLFNGTPTAQASPSKFPDVADGAWYNGYVNWAAENKIVGGRDTGLFDPNAPVSVSEASKMLVVALTGDSTLSYPDGFMKKAGELGLFNGCSYSAANAPASRALIAGMAKNALGISSVLLKNRTSVETFFADKFNVKKGVLAATWTNNLRDGSNRFAGAANKISYIPEGKDISYANATQLTYSGSSVDHLCGLPVNIYYKGNEIVLITLRATKTLTVHAGDVTATGTSYKTYKLASGAALSVDRNAIEKEYKKNTFNRNGVIFLNNIQPGSHQDFTKNTDEMVTFVDTNGDNSFDYVYQVPVLNAMKVVAINKNTITLNGQFGSNASSGWFDGRTAINYTVLEGCGEIKVGDRVNAQFIVDCTSSTYIHKSFPVRAVIRSVCTPEVGTLTATNFTDGNLDISISIDGVKSAWTSTLSAQDYADGYMGYYAGRGFMTLNNIGKQYRFFRDESGFIVRAESLSEATAAVGERQYVSESGVAVDAVIEIHGTFRHNLTKSRVQYYMGMLKELGFTRVWVIASNPGFPSYSTTANGFRQTNSVEEMFKTLGMDTHKAYVEAAHSFGMEIYAIYKPYEQGGASTVPHGVKVPESAYQEETVGGTRVFFDTFTSENQQYRAKRRPDGSDKEDTRPITSIEMVFTADGYTDRGSFNSTTTVKPLTAAQMAAIKKYEIDIWVSKDNGSYTLWKGAYDYDFTTGKRMFKDANGYDLYDSESNAIILNVTGLNIPAEYPYVAVTFRNKANLHTIPYSMIKIFSGSDELWSTVTFYTRTPIESDETEQVNAYNWDIDMKNYKWGNEKTPAACTSLDYIRVAPNGTVKSNDANAIRVQNYFYKFGFEFNWFGSGFWGEGWRCSPVYAIARGKIQEHSGNNCEGYKEVTDYWLSVVEYLCECGFDAIDFRLQAHSAHAYDYINYGYNEPIVKRYQEIYGQNLLEIEITEQVYINLMKVRGLYLTEFFEDAVELIHKYGIKAGINLRNSYLNPTLDGSINEVCWWTMPKVIPDWKACVEMFDFVDIKDYVYYAKDVVPNAGAIKDYAHSLGKEVYIHCYDDQGVKGVTWSKEFVDAAASDERISGVLYYEIIYNKEFMTRLQKTLQECNMTYVDLK